MASIKYYLRLLGVLLVVLFLSAFYNIVSYQTSYGTVINVVHTDKSEELKKRQPMNELQPNQLYRPNSQQHSTSYEIIQSRRNLTKVIMFWTPRLGDKYWATQMGKKVFRGCKYNNCEFTADKSRLEEADILLFYCEERPHFPDKRLPHQLYVHFTREPPTNVKINGYSMYNEDINMTVSYRKDGNLYAPYFHLQPKTEPKEEYKLRIPFQNRSRSIVWMVSNCHPESKRDLYVSKLSQYIDIDIYGQCGNYTCGDVEHFTNKSCFELFETRYKFYLAFENSICQDYYTEKLAYPLEHELIPIVFGGADYEHDFPDHCFINAIDYPNPKDLADYLKSMTAEEFNKYFQWKAKYYVLHGPWHCDLCEFVHDSPYTRGEQILPPSYGGNYTKWWHDSCHNDLIYRLKAKGGW